MIQINEPFHGAVLNHRHGIQGDGELRIQVRGEAPIGDRVLVNGIEAQRSGRGFSAEVPLRDLETDLVAKAQGGTGCGEHRSRVVWDRYSRPRYRFSIDDNSFFARDLARNLRASLFDCFYLQILKRLHREYGAKFVLNMFFTTPERDFDLTQFPDRYKPEWVDNADWLRLSFHALCEFPDRPYQVASAEALAADYDRVAGEIVRFAGEETWSPPTVIHWAMLPSASLQVLASRGVKALSGYFMPTPSGRPTLAGEPHPEAPHLGYDINYMLDDKRSEHVWRHEALKDFDSGIVFSRVDIVCNNTPVDQVKPTLDPLAQDPNAAEIMDLFTHEQYFWPFYADHVPDHAARCEAAIRFCVERGYNPVFFHEGLLGGKE